ncbi:hypothetical protein GHO40_25560 [Pseudomonas helleri]|uniref:3-isopropylmalate dehydratase n=1 Tax=Pseudomonas helleri TaxID=1608996 RepID=A0A7X1WEC0_9PSED|nr:hypothetical protein [Pseudomonas helleri]MQT50051.1 hypothetical protein [Pseudomonas helleri]MQT91122.1 hypothetical protein [Pseudomonas helleri]
MSADWSWVSLASARRSIRRRRQHAGSNFGCGSSREHAVWAIIDYGFQAVLAPRMADIFRNNALNNGLLAIEISEKIHTKLVNQTNARVTVDLEAQTIIDDEGCSEKLKSIHLRAIA